MSKCKLKKCKYVPSITECVCPKCGEGSGVFFIEYVNRPCKNPHCTSLHERDELCCGHCGYRVKAKKYVDKLIKDKGIEICTCPQCNGQGWTTIQKITRS